MKQRLCIFVLVFSCFAVSQAALAATWYVRADGGTRYSVRMTTGQCDGLADAAYPGAGVNQHCAFGDYRYLWDDQSYGNSAWVIAGGDTVIVDNTRQWRVGFDGDGSSSDPWCFGGNGAYDCINPTIPAGTASQHTRILGRNYASCSVGNAPDLSKMTQIFGGHGIYTPLYLKGAQYVDVQCLEITRHSQCIIHGSPAYPSQCSSSVPLDDYDADGIQTDVNTHDVLFQDLWIHGHTDRGIIGPIGGVVTANRVNIAYNGLAGWDFDDGNGTASLNATLNFSHSVIEWNGCNQEYPIVDTYPAISCYSQSSGGYGDGIGTPAGMGMNVNIDHSIFRYNTQDGEDFGHIDTGSSALSITDSLSYGNNGGQFKWGPNFTSVLFENNLVVGNCRRMSAPIAGAPSTYNTNLADYCRAGDALSFNFVQGSTALFANNTIVTYAPTTFDMQCVGASCSSTVFTLTNNIVLGYDNPGTYNSGGQAGGPGNYCGAGCNNSTQPIGTINRYNNSYFGLRYCPAGNAIGSSTGTISNETCNDPLFSGEPPSFLNESTLDNYDFALSAGSPATQSGIAVNGLSTDYLGVARPTPPSLGALQYASGASAPTLSFVLVANQTYGAAPFAVSASSASSGIVTYSVTSGPATLSGNLVTLTGAGTIVLGATQAAASGYASATATISFTVAPALPSLSFAAIGGQTFGAAPFTVSAASASGGVVTYSVTGGPAVLSGSTLTLTAAGTVVLTASQAATPNYLAATATTSFTVAPALPLLSFAAIGGQTFGNSPLTVSATSASCGAVTYSVVSGPAIVSGSTLTLTGTGTVVLRANQAAIGSYLAATATISFSIAPALPLLSFVPIGSQTFGNSPFTVSAASASCGAVTYSVLSGPATLSGSTLTLTGAGTVVLSASQTATADYLAATATTSFTVRPALPLLSFVAIGSQTFGNSPISVSAASASSGAVTYSVVSGPATLSGNTLTLTGAGTVVVGASQAATANYLAATTILNFSVAPALPVLSFTAIGSKTFGSAPFAVSATSASSGAVTYAVVRGPASLSGNTLTLTGAGTVALSASQAATTNYLATTAIISFPVAPALPLLSFAPIPNQPFSVAPMSVNASSASSGTVTYAVSSGPATISGHTLTLSGLGTVMLSASQAASGNYTAATAATSFTVLPVAEVLSFAAIPSQTYGNAPVRVSATSVSNGAITYSVSRGPATISGNLVTLTGAGSVILNASQAAIGTYAAATAIVTLPVAPETSTLSFVSIPNQINGAAPFPVSASSASDGVVSYAVTSGPATVSGNTVTLTGVGTVVLSAAQQATQNYTAAATTTTFVVAAAFKLATTGGSATTQPTATTTPGGAATYSFTLTPGSGTVFVNAVDLAATGLPPGATASFSPAKISVGSEATTVILTIQTSSQTAASREPSRGRPTAPLALCVMLLPWMGVSAARKRLLRAPRLVALLAAMLMSGALGLSGCATSGPQTQSAPQTYTVAITGTDVASGWKSTTNVSLIVQ